MKPRVLMVIGQFWPILGGAEVQCQRLSSELARQRYDVTVLTGRNQGSSPSEETLDGYQVIRCAIFPIPKLRNLSFLLSLAWSLWRLRHTYDIIHVYQALRPASVATVMGRLLGKPVIIKVSGGGKGSDITRMRKRGNRDFFSLWDPLLWRPIKWCDRIIAVSSEIKEELNQAGFAPEKVVSIPHGVAVDTYPKSSEMTARSETVQATCVAGLRPIKGVDVLLDAARRVQGVHFHVVGDGPQLRQLLTMKTTLGLDGVVTFHGRREDVAEFLARAHIAVFPSRAEGMSNALLEAMAQGLPCVATAVGGNRDMIQDGFNGLLVPSEDPDALAQAILHLAADSGLRASLGLEAWQTVRERYNLPTVAAQYDSLYAQLVGRKGPANSYG